MKIGRHYLGKIVEIRWSDPNYGKVDLSQLRLGRAALAKWREYGYIHDLTDGVLILIHSYGALNPDSNEGDELCCTAIPEEIIDSITVLSPEPAEGK